MNILKHIKDQKCSVVHCVNCGATNKPLKLIKKGFDAYICDECLIKWYKGQKKLQKGRK